MIPPRFAVASALVIPALLFLSCKDTNENPVAPDSPGIGTPRSSGGGGIDPSKIRFPPIPEAVLALAVLEDAAAEAEEAASLSATTTASDELAPHGHQGRMLVICNDGDEATGDPSVNGEASRFRSNRGCELSTYDGDANPDNNGAFVITAQQRLLGRLLTKVTRLEFIYAGGDAVSGNPGSPRWTLWIDECEPTTGVGTANCPPGQETDGQLDALARIDADGCNDGDANVGVLKVVGNSACEVLYKDVAYPNWSAFLSAFPGARMAAGLWPYISIEAEHLHYVIYGVLAR